ncbi:Annexin [Piromyces finnis]|uniref:Annexin n=1 Tax=Piromyces finnis TaxID=1754191 RepID=A0A1Y1VFP9_9FUNG|nr:Annexin [Piromyces finnis]|eukprot:ORX55244.1 Annexin [Piromyces finnis]
MNNYVLSGIPHSTSFGYQLSFSSQFGVLNLNQNNNDNNIQLQIIQNEIQNLQSSPTMISPVLAIDDQKNVQQLQLKLQYLQQLQIQNGIGSISLNNSLLTNNLDTLYKDINANPNYGVAMNYADTNQEIYSSLKNTKKDMRDYSKLIDFLSRYLPLVMNQIIIEFKKEDKERTLESYVKEVTKGDFEKLCSSLSRTVLENDVWYLRNAIKGLGTDDDCTYKETYNKNLEEDVRGDTSGDYRNALVSILKANRNENDFQFNDKDASEDVFTLYRSGEGKVGTDEDVFIEILTNRPYSHLIQIFEMYQQKYSNSMESAIKSEFSGDIKKTLLAIVKTTKNLSQYIAEQIENSMKGLGTRNDKLIRLIVCYREPALMERIKKDYQKLYNKTLAERIDGKISDKDYKNLLLACIGELI